jgi:5-deoxy-D-glucuronate isomerase
VAWVIGSISLSSTLKPRNQMSARSITSPFTTSPRRIIYLQTRKIASLKAQESFRMAEVKSKSSCQSIKIKLMTLRNVSINSKSRKRRSNKRRKMSSIREFSSRIRPISPFKPWRIETLEVCSISSRACHKDKTSR